MRGLTAASVLMVAVAGAPASAQAIEKAFTGPSAGAEAGYLEHHFVLEFEASGAGGALLARESRYFRSHGVGGGAFAGYDVAVSKRGRLGVELAASAGGADNSFDAPSRGRLTLTPRYGVLAAARAGYVVAPRLMLYGLSGYGGQAYRVRDTVPIEGSRALRWGSSFVVGAGAEYRLSRRIGLRLDGKHVDNQSWQLLAGVPIRF